MSIEKSPAPAASAKAPARADTSPAGKARSGEGAEAGAATGFMAILGALGDVADAAPVPSTGADTAPPDLGASALPADATAPAFDASLLLQQNPQIAAAQLLQRATAALATASQAPTAAATAAATAATATASAPGAGASNGALAVAGSGALAGRATTASKAASDAALVGVPTLATPAMAAAGTSTTAASTADASTSLPPTASPARPVAGDTAASHAAALPGTAVPQAAPELAQAATQGLQQAGLRARLARDAQQGDAPSSLASSAGTHSNAAASAVAPDASRLQMAQELARSPQFEQLLEPLLAPLQARPDKAQSERGGFGFLASEPTYTYSGSTLGVSAPDFSQSGAPAPVMAPEMQVAEQVSYWVSQNVQNAELTLDGLGQLPVEVSISVQGNEAQVVFRSDEAATRSMLEGAGSQLKDALQREGLVLTGVSVGNSGSGEAGNGERRARQNARQGVIAPLQVANTDSGPRARVDVGRSVDLFV